ncbi:MAG: succinate dehydrogenase iron-sulfur subunit [Thermoplasmata archaeon]|nr:succinate dehydrogenase iron-sulfur subunit [Thermoplasmata archaeon]
MNATMRTVQFQIRRSRPSDGGEFRQYPLEVDRYTTVLEGLLTIREQQDPGLALRYSCRMGMCGSCGMRINGRPALACLTRVSTLGEKVVVEPMRGFGLVKDLVPELAPFFAKYGSVQPTLHAPDPVEQEHPTSAFRQTPAEVGRYLQFNYCIQCGLCASACPISASDEQFIGPAALTVAYRYTSDSRDASAPLRLSIVDTKHGVWGCRVAGSCSYVCPKGVDPSLAIQKLKGMTLRPTRAVAEAAPTSPRDGPA